MALDMVLLIRERETGTVTEEYIQLSLTPRELGNVHYFIDAINDGVDLTN